MGNCMVGLKEEVVVVVVEVVVVVVVVVFQGWLGKLLLVVV